MPRPCRAYDRGIVRSVLEPEQRLRHDSCRIKSLDSASPSSTRPTPLSAKEIRAPVRGPRNGLVLGTVGSMSPKQVRGKAVDLAQRSSLSGRCGTRCSRAGARSTRQRGRDDERVPEEDPPRCPGRAGISPRLAAHAPLSGEGAGDASLGPRSRPCAQAPVRFSTVARTRFCAAFDVSLKRQKRRLLVALAAMVLVAGALTASVRSPAPTGVDVIDAAAVLPSRRRGDPDREYPSDGIADTLVNELFGLPNLRSIARSTSFCFRRSGADPRKVGRSRSGRCRPAPFPTGARSWSSEPSSSTSPGTASPGER